MNIVRTMLQPVEKVGAGWKFDLENAVLRREKIRLDLCLINLFRFCPVAIITPSIFTLSKRLKRKRLKW